MDYNIYFDIAAICVMAIIIISYGVGKRLHDMQNRVLVTMILCTMLLAFVDIASAAMSGSSIKGGRQILYTIIYVYYALHIVLAVSFFSYCRCLIGRLKQTVAWKRVLMAVPGILMGITLLMQFFSNVVFQIDAQVQYHRMWGMFVIYFGMLVYGIMGIACLLVYRRRASLETRISCILFVGVCTLFILAQYIMPQMKLEAFGFSICILLFYLSMEKPEELIDSELDLLNQRAMLKLMRGKYQLGERVPCVMLKIHNLKVMRQTMGAETIQILLKQIAEYLEDNFEEAMIFHFSQSVFVLTFDKKTSPEEVVDVVHDIRRRFEQTWDDGSMDTRLYIHVASLECPKDAPDMNTFMSYLQYMRSSSSEQRDEMLDISDMNIEKQNREMRIRKIVADAVEHEGFEVFYQPIFAVGEGRIISAEALIRLKDQSMGYISPEEFIPIAEQSGAILKIGEYVFESVCQFLQEENLKNYGIHYIEINLSVVQCMQNDLVERLMRIMDKYGIAAEQINLEITETAAIHSTEIFEENIRKLHECGIQFSLDDYGSGYSNTDYLFHFPFKMVKIDKMILWEACKNERAMIALRNTIKMIKELGLDVVVEGVETLENVEYLTEQKCDFLQGYFYSKPVPKQRFLDLLEQMRA